MRSVLTLLIAIALFSCNRKTLPQQVPVNSTELVRERTVPVPVPGDSSLLSALFACDSLNNVYLQAISEQKGKSVESGVKFENSRLLIKQFTGMIRFWCRLRTPYVKRKYLLW